VYCVAVFYYHKINNDIIYVLYIIIEYNIIFRLREELNN